MKFKILPSLLAMLLTSWLLTVMPVAQAGDCDQSQLLYLHGLTKTRFQKWSVAKDLLTQSVSMCNRFNNWYLLGKTNIEIGALDEAAAAFEDARRYATDDNERSVAIARYAEVQAIQGSVNQSLSLLREARDMHTSTPAWMLTLIRELDDQRVSRPLTVAMVTGALSNKSINRLHLKSKPSLYINLDFEYDSDKLKPKSISSVNILAKAFMDKSIRGKKLMITSHTDRRGSDVYNHKLSQQRAKSIALILLKQYPTLRTRIKSEGRGEEKPLYSGGGSWEYHMNSRIEISVLE